MKYLDIIEENFTKADYVAYLRGYILKSLLEDKPLDTLQFKLCADKLVALLEDQGNEQPKQLMVDPDEPKVQPKHEFKLGDHVVVSKGTDDERTGVIVRLPMEGVDCKSSYVVDLDDKNLGWEAKVAVDGVDCKNAWVTGARNMELLPTTLQKNTWYHTTDFTANELSKLLQSGTKVLVEAEVLYNNIDTTPPTKTKQAVVKTVVPSAIEEQTFLKITNGSFYKEWFKIVQED